MKEIRLTLTDAQYKGLQAFAEDWSAWHLTDAPPPDNNPPVLSDDLAVLICVLYTAVGPKRPEEVGACSLQPSEIDDSELVEFVRNQLR